MEEDYKLVSKNDAILKTKTERFDFTNPPEDPIKLAYLLSDVMIKEEGIGLAAPQIGLPYRVFVMGKSPIICCFNPFIVDKKEIPNFGFSKIAVSLHIIAITVHIRGI